MQSKWLSDQGWQGCMGIRHRDGILHTQAEKFEPRGTDMLLQKANLGLHAGLDRAFARIAP